MRRWLEWLVAVALAVPGALPGASLLSVSPPSTVLPPTLVPPPPGGGGLATVLLANLVPGQVDAKVYELDGRTGLDSEYVGQLYVGLSPDPGDLVAVDVPTPFRTGAARGYVTSREVTIPNLPAGAVVFVQVRVWRFSLGSTFEAARLENPDDVGTSSVLAVATGGGGPSLHGLAVPPASSPAGVLLGLESFSVGQADALFLSRGQPETRRALVSGSAVVNGARCADNLGNKRAYRVTPAETGRIAVETTASPFRAVLEVYAGTHTGDPAKVLACSAAADGNDTRLSFQGTGGLLYTALISGRDRAEGEVDVVWELLAERSPVTFTFASLETVYDGQPKPVVVTPDPSLPASAIQITYDGAAAPPTEARDYAVRVVAEDAGHYGEANVIFRILQASQMIPFVLPASRFFGTPPISLPETTDRNLPIDFKIEGPAERVGNSLRLTAPGLVVVTATQQGNTNVTAAAEVRQELSVLAPSVQLAGARLTPGGLFEARVAGPANVRVVVESTADWGSAWTGEGAFVLQAAAPVLFSTPAAEGGGRRFYRARVEAAP